MLSRYLGRDVQTVTGKNLQYIQEEAGLSPWTTSKSRLRDALAAEELVDVPPQDRWRLPYLNSLLCQRREAINLALEDEEDRLSSLIDSLLANYTFLSLEVS